MSLAKYYDLEAAYYNCLALFNIMKNIGLRSFRAYSHTLYVVH